MSDTNKLFHIDCEIKTLTDMLDTVDKDKVKSIKEEILILKRKYNRIKRRCKRRGKEHK